MNNSEIIEKRSISGYGLATWNWNWIWKKNSRQQHTSERSHPQHSDSEQLISDHVVIEIGSLNSKQHTDDDQLIIGSFDSDGTRSLLDSTPGDPVVKGFINDIGICYINVVLQNLLATDVLRNYFIQPVDKYGPLHVSMRKLFLDTSVEADADSRTRGRLDARPLFYIMRDKYPDVYERGKGGDSLLFFLELVDILFAEEVSSIKPHQASLVEIMFGVELEIEYYSYISWLNLRYHCTREDSITFDFPINDDHGNVTIERCLEVYLRNMLLTSRIKLFDVLPIAKMDASRTSIITKAPPILPFTFDTEFSSSTKVEFTETFDIKPYMDSKCIDKDNTYQYKLVGLIEMVGDAHVVAYVNRTSTTGHGLWYHVNNSQVEQVYVDKVLGCTPFMLFYERCRGSRK